MNSRWFSALWRHRNREIDSDEEALIIDEEELVEGENAGVVNATNAKEADKRISRWSAFWCILILTLVLTALVAMGLLLKYTAEMDVEDFGIVYAEKTADFFITLSYFVIPVFILYVVRKREDLHNHKSLLITSLFGGFIVCCGCTHGIAVLSPWASVKTFLVGAKVITAIISFVTAVVVFFLIPTAFMIPSIIQLEQEIEERIGAQRLLQSQYERHVLLSKVTRKISKSLKASEIFDATAARLAQTFNVSACSVHLFYTEDNGSEEEKKSQQPNQQIRTVNKKLRKLRKKANLRFENRMMEIEDYYKDSNEAERVGESDSSWDAGVPWNVDEDSCEQESRLLSYVARKKKKESEQNSHVGDEESESSARSPSPSSLPPEPQVVTALLTEHFTDGYNGDHISCQDRDIPFHKVEDLANAEVAVAIDVEGGVYYFHDYGESGDRPTKFPLDPQFIQSMREIGTKSLLCISVSYLNERARAVILLHDKEHSGRVWASAEMALLEEVMARVEVGLAQTRLMDQQTRQFQLMKWQNEELKQARMAAEKANNAKSDFLAMVSHELRTPMNAVCGMATVLLDSPDLQSEDAKCVEIISKSSKSLLSLINTILDFSKIEAGKAELRYERFDLHNQISKAIALFQAHLHKKKNVALKVAPFDELPRFFRGDKQRLNQIILNLLSNAIKFTEEGEISLQVRVNRKWQGHGSEMPGRDGSDEGEESSSSDSEQAVELCELQVSVSDTGIGIPEENLHLLFKAFSQVDSSLRRRYEGTGLGLAICKNLCEMMGGRIWVESKEGVGSTFSFTVILQCVGEEEEKQILARKAERFSIRASEQSLSRQSSSDVEDLKWDGSLSTDTGAELWNTFFESTKGKEKQREKRQPSSPRRRSRPKTPRENQTHTSPLHDLPLIQSDSSLRPGGPLLRHLPRPRADSKLNISPWRVLLAEDNVVNQKVALRLLKKIGYEDVVVVSDGYQAFEACVAAYQSQLPFLIILMDLHMPGMDGVTAARRIREEVKDHRIPYIIACSANLQDGVRSICFKAGINDYVSKPIQVRKLEEALRVAKQTVVAQREKLLIRTMRKFSVPAAGNE